MTPGQAEKAERLRALHHGAKPLVLVNAWDAVSAKCISDLGFPAVATSSAAVAASLGYEDEEQTPRDAMLQAVARVCASVAVPVSADLQSGYGLSVEDAVLTARAAIEAGAAGMNFEDGTNDPRAPLMPLEKQCERIAAIRHVANESGVALVINARIDTYLALQTTAEERERETIRRAHAYLDAGADSIFPIMLADERAIARLVREIPAPVNILFRSDGPGLQQLTSLGVRRMSFGSRPMHVAMQALRDFAQPFSL
jgi:2-methylisocitrate lyase-like PEP mutase family enzyme